MPATQPAGTQLKLRAVSYRLVTQVDRAFPTGTVTLVLLVVVVCHS